MGLLKKSKCFLDRPEGVGRRIVYDDICWNEVSDKHPGTEVF